MVANMEEKAVATHVWKCLVPGCDVTLGMSIDMIDHLEDAHGYSVKSLEHHYDTIVVRAILASLDVT